MAAGTTQAVPTVEETTAGAAPHDQDWRQIDWYQIQREVRRLQTRIVKARQDWLRASICPCQIKGSAL